MKPTSPSDGPSSFSELGKRVTTWPATYQKTGDAGWSAPQQWVERFGERYGISSTNSLRQLVVAGHVTAVTVDRLGELLGGISSKPSAAKDAYIYNDPGVYADPGPLTAVAWWKGTAGIVTTPMPGIRTTLMDTDRSTSYQAIADEAKRDGIAVVRLAWTTNKGAARVVEYLDVASATTRTPTAEEDLEGTTEVRSVRLYTQTDQMDDLIAAVKALRDKTAPQATTTGQSNQPVLKPSDKDWLEKAMTHESPMARRETIFAQSRSFAGCAPAVPTAKSSHIIYLAKSAAELSAKFSSDGFARVHAGIVSNYGYMMPSKSSKGMMDESSRIFIAFRNGDSFSIEFCAPYCGLEPGNGPAANLLISRSATEKVKNPITINMRDVGMMLPNLPFIVSREIATGGFNVPSDARRSIWTTIHTTLGWEQ